MYIKKNALFCIFIAALYLCYKTCFYLCIGKKKEKNEITYIQ
jgi:hypothetical protein